MKSNVTFLGITLATAALFVLPACATSPAPQPATPSPQIQTRANNAFSNLDGDGADRALEDDAQQMGQAIDAAKAGDAPSESAANVSAEVPTETSNEEPVPEAMTEASSQEADDKYASAPPALEAPVTPEVQPNVASTSSTPVCTVGAAPGKRQPSTTAKQILCARAPYDLSCSDGPIDISVVSVGGLGIPWTFSASGCGMNALYHMTGNNLFFVNGGSTAIAAPENSSDCTIQPYEGRQISNDAKVLLCARSRTDLQCPGDLVVHVLQIGVPPIPWLFAVQGCGYETRYSMVGNNVISRDY